MRYLILSCFLSSIFLYACNNDASKPGSEMHTYAFDTLDYQRFGIEKSSLPGLRPLTEGTQAPDFSALDQHGEQVELSSMLEESKVVLIFYRGNWCPYCSRYLQDLTDSLSLIESKGARIIAIAPESSNEVDETAVLPESEIIVISGQVDDIMKEYGVAFTVNNDYNEKIENMKGLKLSEVNNQDSAVLPVPATYIIGRDGSIEWVYFDLDYTKRVPVSEIVANL